MHNDQRHNSKNPAQFPEQGFLNLAPLTGIAFAINWLIDKLNLNSLFVKTTRMTTNFDPYQPTNPFQMIWSERVHRNHAHRWLRRHITSSV
jgi:hypothetical protein